MDQIKRAFPIRVEIASALKKAIFAREYSYGDELNLTEIASQLGVSRTPVREAIRNNNPEAAREAMRFHITRSMNNILKKYPE